MEYTARFPVKRAVGLALQDVDSNNCRVCDAGVGDERRSAVCARADTLRLAQKGVRDTEREDSAGSTLRRGVNGKADRLIAQP